MIKSIKNISQQARWWAYAAWTAPFVALAALVTEHFFAPSLYGITIMCITSTFIAVSVYWWWWALTRIVEMTKMAQRNEDKFAEILHEIKQSKQVLTELNDSSRKR